MTWGWWVTFPAPPPGPIQHTHSPPLTPHFLTLYMQPLHLTTLQPSLTAHTLLPPSLPCKNLLLPSFPPSLPPSDWPLLAGTNEALACGVVVWVAWCGQVSLSAGVLIMQLWHLLRCCLATLASAEVLCGNLRHLFQLLYGNLTSRPTQGGVRQLRHLHKMVWGNLDISTR